MVLPVMRGDTTIKLSQLLAKLQEVGETDPDINIVAWEWADPGDHIASESGALLDVTVGTDEVTLHFDMNSEPDE